MKRLLLSLVTLALLITGCYKDDIDNLNRKVDNLAGQYETIRAALDAKQTVTGIENTAGGYTITFSGGQTVEVKNGSTPVFTAGSNGNWFVDGADTGIKATAAEIEIAGGYWHIDGVNTGVKAAGADGINGTSPPAITGIVIAGGSMTFTFSNATQLVVPMAATPVSLSIACAGIQVFRFGETKTFDVVQSGVGNISVSKPDGWKVSLSGDKITVTAPAAENTYAEHDGTVSVVAVGESGTAIAGMRIHATGGNYNRLIDFEDPRVADYLAGPTSYGENLYDGHPNQYFGYDDAGSGLCMMINEDPYSPGVYNYWNGGIAISQWNNITAASYTNQCSAYYSDATTGRGGYGGSATFAVNNGSGTVSFADGATECTFDHFHVTNSTYAALSMMNGDGYARKFETGDWFRLVITAEDKDGAPTGTPVEFYLADFRTGASPGILTEWAMVDLTPLGSHVHALKFDLQSTDNSVYGMNTPAYFCFDNLALKK
ncbi:MAG: DUF4988 and DUF4465 domain-containing protein [Bacteroidales bacterium]|jgi:hypothetical protein|nr:DUF4988 and DUF4465 domain-containing protein [Bacteroidales bacterium]